MKALSKRADEVFRKLIEGLTKPGDHRKIDNANGSFMPVSVEIIGRSGLGLLISIAHWYEQNRDLLRDPEVIFLIGADQHVYPLSFRQDNLGIDQEAAYVEDGVWKVRPKMQEDITKFCNMWLRNIKEQQQLGVQSQ